MNDHETYLLLAAKRVDERLTPDEEAALEEHLARCPSCRATAAGMRRDDIMLRAVLSPVPVAPPVRQRILEEASARRRLAAARLVLPLAATLIIAAVGVPLIAGALRPPEASGIPSASTATAAPTLSPAPSATASPSPSTSPSPSASESTQPSPSAGGLVNGSYTYSDSVPRRAAISARLVDGQPDGAWSRRVPATGVSKVWNGTMSCLVIDGADAWMAGPVTDSTEDGVNQAIFILVHDGGRNGEGDRVSMWLDDHGETLHLLEGWCRDKFRPGPTYPLTSGDIFVDADGQ